MADAGQGGFVLLESLLVAVLLGVGILGLAALQVATTAARGQARARLGARMLAISALEQGRLGEPPEAGRYRLEVTPLETGPGLRVRVGWEGGPERYTLARLTAPGGGR